MINVLRTNPFFNKFSPRQLNSIISILKEKTFSKDEAIFHQGDACHNAYILTEGRVKASKFSSDGRELIIHFFSKGDLFGEAPLFIERGLYPVSAYACEDSKCYYFTRDDLKELILKEPDISFYLLEIYSSKLIFLMDKIEDLTLKDVRTRIIQFLINQIPKELIKNDGMVQIHLPFSQTDIASRLGTVREQVSRAFSKLSNEGIIEVHGKNVNILNLSLLKKEVFLS